MFKVNSKDIFHIYFEHISQHIGVSVVKFGQIMPAGSILYYQLGKKDVSCLIKRLNSTYRDFRLVPYFQVSDRLPYEIHTYMHTRTYTHN